ncbi:hypothetical protein ACP70R_013700 [Stipagrostis hirtigluma subsp. patula]
MRSEQAMDKRRRSCSSSHGSESDSSSGKKQKCSSSGQGWISRCSPSRLIQTTQNFTQEQCDLIKRNGFGSLLNLKCQKNPPDLLYHWLAKHFNCATSELVFSNGTIIPVTAKSVQRILGIPYGNRKVKYRMDAETLIGVHYLDHLDTGSYRVPDSIPRAVVWTTKVIEKVVNMDTISEADGIYGKLPVKAIVNNTGINTGLKFPPIIGAGLTVEQFVSSHLAVDCDPSVKDELCRVVNNFCTNATSLLSMFVGSFLRDVSGLIPSSSNTMPQAREEPTRTSSQARQGDLGDEGSDEYYSEDDTSVEDMSVSEDASEDVSNDENSSSESYSDDVSSHDDANEESDDSHAILDASGNEHAHEQDGNNGNDICKKEVAVEHFPEVPVPPGYPDMPRLKQEPGSPADNSSLHQHTVNENPVVVRSGDVQLEQHVRRK